MANFSFIAEEDTSDLPVKQSYIQSSALTRGLADKLCALSETMDASPEIGKNTDFSLLHLICLEEEVSIKNTLFDKGQILFKTDYPKQFLFISTKILTDPTLSRLLIFNGIKCEVPDVIESIQFTTSQQTLPTINPTRGAPVDLQIEIEDLVRVLIVFNIPRRSEAFDFALRIKDRNGTRTDFLCDPQVGNDPVPAPVLRTPVLRHGIARTLLG
jgi:hypothetical protein